LAGGSIESTVWLWNPEQSNEQLYRSLAGAGWLATRQTQLAWVIARRIRLKWWALAAGTVAAGVLIGVFAARYRGWLFGLVVATAGAAATLAGPAKAVWEKIRQLRQRVAATVDAEQARLDLAVSVATREVADLQRQLQNLTAAGQLAGLVAEQAAAGSYRSRLGLMTQIREVFEQMARLLAAKADQAPAEPAEDLVGDELPRIDRIVVYIDDLDRCPPERVVQVLEAVQLLLAVPLFVVVVAVDPRWLLRSLTVHYEEIFDAPNHVGTSKDRSWGSTPMQYLEKIFQIPFTLRPVDGTGYIAMVDALIASSTTSAAGPVTSSPAVTEQAMSERPAAERAAPRIVNGSPLPLPAPRVAERFDPLALTDDEQRLMALLGPPLITTPRSIKRLVNSYGLLNALRGSRHARDLTENRHAGTGSQYYPYRAAMTLLGTLIAFPDLSPTFFLSLLKSSSDSNSLSWPNFLDRIFPAWDHGRWCSEFLGVIANETEVHHWRTLISELQRFTASANDIGLPLPEPLEAWAEWVIPVGRLSFETGRSISTLGFPYHLRD
jgi:hypothetical protein